MTLTEFKQALIDMGYKQHKCANNDLDVYKNRNKRIDIYYGGDYYSVFYEKTIKSGYIEYNQHKVDFAKALKNIKKFERKIGR